MPFTLRDIPATMRLKGWTVGAAMMDRWFAGEAWAMSPQEKNGAVPITAFTGERIETKLVTMQWALSFARINSVHFHLLNSWSTAARLAAAAPTLNKRLSTWLAAHPADAGTTFRFGDLAASVREIETTCQINFDRTSGSIWDPLDDFYAAIGECVIKIAVSGIAAPADGGYQLTIDEIGTYLRDTYDFIGDQDLGYWSRYGVEKVLLPLYRIPLDPKTANNDGEWDRGTYYKVDNGSFRQYRTVYGKGRDFFVHSDVRRLKLAHPVVVTVNP